MGPGGNRTERMLVDRFLHSRCEPSFLPLFEVLYPKLYRFFSAHGLDRPVSEELAQDVLFTVYRQIDQLRDRDLFFGWLFKIARNAMLQHVRRERANLQLFDEVPMPTFTPDALRPNRLESWVAELDEPSRRVILLRFVEELSYQEIAEALEMPIGTVKWRLFNAKSKLQGIFASSAGRI